jgi:hypothetical protein
MPLINIPVCNKLTDTFEKHGCLRRRARRRVIPRPGSLRLAQRSLGREDSSMVGMLGINVYRVFMLVFGIGAMAAGFAGIVNAPVVSLTPDMGDSILVQTFVVVVIGGVGSFPGAILGGLLSYYGDSHILFDLSLHVERNEVVALLAATAPARARR